MGCSPLASSELNTGLDLLVTSLVKGRCEVIAHHGLENLIEGSLQQLEVDDTINASITDAIVESLVEAQELLEEGEEPWKALEQMMSLYHQAKSQKSLFEIWTERAEGFTSEDIRTELFDTFQEAVGIVKWGKGEVVTDWLNTQIADFRNHLNGYHKLYVADDEITMESEMCHLFLMRGAEAWLEALIGLQREILHGVGSSDVEDKAEQGQRLLMAVQVFEAEATLAESKYFVNFN